jgi:hypothetical protein
MPATELSNWEDETYSADPRPTTVDVRAVAIAMEIPATELRSCDDDT